MFSLSELQQSWHAALTTNPDQTKSLLDAGILRAAVRVRFILAQHDNKKNSLCVVEAGLMIACSIQLSNRHSTENEHVFQTRHRIIITDYEISVFL